MSGAPLLVILAAAAIWPFGRDRDKDAEGTIAALEANAVQIDRGGAIEGSEAKAIESYRSFLDLASQDPLLRAEAMRRLADLQLETSEAEQLQSNVQSLGSAFTDTIGMYEQLLESYPSYAKNDLVLYQLARAYEADGRLEQALATLDRLIAEHPATPHFDEAQFRRGETLFVEKRYADAEQAYADVLREGPESAFYEQALYKHGWSRFKQQLYEESLTSFFGLLDRRLGADNDPSAPDPAVLFGAMSRAEQELVEDTLRVLSISFSYLDGPEAITEYFSANGTKPYSFIVYTNMGDLYLEQERYQDAADAYRAFVELDPYHGKAPLLQAEVIEAFKQGGFADLVLDGKRGFVETYGPSSPYWQRFSYEQQPEVVSHLKTNVTDLAAFHHAAAQESKEPSEYAQAARWYRTYLQSFPEDQDAPRTNFLLAEVLYESGRYRDAALEYERTAYAYPFHEHGGEAGYAALLAYGKEEEALAGAARVEWHRQGIESALRFAAGYPAHEQAATVQTNAAEKLFALREFERARDVAGAVVARVPAAELPLQATAWTVVAHSEFDLGQFAQAEHAYVQLQSVLPPGDARHAEIAERVASSIYKQGEQARSAADYEGAVAHFLRVASAAPSSSIRPTAEYDAAAALIQMGDWTRATAVLEAFRSAFPDHELAADATANLAIGYVETGNSTLAAGEFARIAESDGDPAVQREALWRAAELYETSGRGADAALAYARFVARYPQPASEAIEARQKLIDLAGAAGNAAEQARWRADLVLADAAAGAERTDRTRYLAARAQLALAAPARDAFLGTRLVIPLERSLQAKQARMEDALAEYGKAADYGVAEVTTAANYEIAELYHALGKDLMASERPADLAAEELEQYDLLLEEQAFPFEEEAIELHELNAARTADGLYDEWVKRSLSALAELLPARYAKTERAADAIDLPREAAAAAEGQAEEGRRGRRSRGAPQAREAAPAVLPAEAVAAHARAAEALRAGNLLQAQLELEALAANPADVTAHVNLAIAYRKDGRGAQARAALDRALAAEPGNAAANDLLAVTLREQGDFAGAEAAYRRAIEADAAYAAAHYNFGVLLDVYLRRHGEALEQYELYQSAQAEPDTVVGRWIVDLKRRLGVNEAPPQVAQEHGT